MYFLSKVRLIFKQDMLDDNETHELVQLVQASDKQKAREAVEKDFIKNSTSDTFVILEVRIDDTIIGE